MVCLFAQTKYIFIKYSLAVLGHEGSVWVQRSIKTESIDNGECECNSAPVCVPDTTIGDALRRPLVNKSKQDSLEPVQFQIEMANLRKY